MNFLYSTVNTIRDRYTPATNTSNFYTTGQISPEEFLLAGDYLTNKFPTWSWSSAESPALSVSHLPPNKQFLVTKNVPCHRRLDEDFAGDAGHEEAVVGISGEDGVGGEDGWLRTGGMVSSQGLKVKEIRTVDDEGVVGEGEVVEEDEDIPDMEDEEDDDAIIRDEQADGVSGGRRTYNLYIMYSPFYRTPRLYLSGFLPTGQPLPPAAMMDDIIGDYKDKTVTIENFPFLSSAKMASIHPCKHASVMKLMLDRAEAALRLRREKMARAKELSQEEGVDFGVGEEVGVGGETGVAGAGDEWEEVEESEAREERAIRVDQYLVVFLKFMASVTPGIEHDFTMSI